MYEHAKRATSAILAGAVVLGTLAINPYGKKGDVNAATLYDSASAVNYATILGDGVIYGIVAGELLQANHFETTFATKSFTNIDPYNPTSDGSNNDIDYVDSTAGLIIGELSSGKIKFGKCTASSLYIDAPSEVFGNYDTDYLKTHDDGTSGNITFGNEFKAIDPYTEVIPVIDSDASDKVDALLDNAVSSTSGWSKYINDRANDSAYVLNPNGVVCDYIEVTNSVPWNKVAIKLDEDEFENKVVYVNVTTDMLYALMNSAQFTIEKRESTVVIFNIEDEVVTSDVLNSNANQNKGKLHLNKPIVVCNNLNYAGTTAVNGKRTEAYGHGSSDGVLAADVQKMYNETIVWNVLADEDVVLEDMGGLMLFPNAQSVDLKNGNTSGWIVANNEVQAHTEFHFLFNGESKDKKGQFHFGFDKAFTKTYADESSVQRDYSIDIPEDTYEFSLQEYEDSDFKIPYDDPIVAYVDTNGSLVFDSYTFTCKDNDDSHYNIEKPSGDTPNSKTYYFKISENDLPSTITDIEKSDGYIYAKLTVEVDSKGVFNFSYDYQSYTGKDPSTKKNILFRDYSGYEKVMGSEADLGLFFNKIKNPYIDITKTLEGAITDEDFENLTFVLYEYDLSTQQSTMKKTYTLGDDFELDEAGSTYVLKEKYAADKTKTYYVLETNIATDDYKIVSVSYTLTNNDTGKVTSGFDSGVPTSRFTVDELNNDDNTFTVAFTNAYKSTLYGDLTVMKTANDGGSTNINEDFYFTVQNTEGKYLQDDGTFTTSEHFFTVAANSTTGKTFKNLPVGEYTITEDPSKTTVEGYKLNSSSSTSGKKTVIGGDTVTFDLTNIYDATGSLTVTKVETGDVPTTGKPTSYEFAVKCGDKYVKDATTGELGDSPVYFTVSTTASKKISGLALDKTYVVIEKDVENLPAGYTCTPSYDPSTLELTSTTKSGKITITNTYSTPTPTPTIGVLEVEKAVAGTTPATGMPSEYKFYVTSGDKYVQADGSLGDSEYDFTVTAGSTVKIENLEIGKTYKVVEKSVDGLPTGYTSVASYSPSDSISLDSTTTSGKVKITNTFSTPTPAPTIGVLEVEKAVAGTTPATGMPSEYKFYVTSGDKYVQADGSLGDSEYDFTVTAGSTVKIENLEIGRTYKVVEKSVDGLPTGYTSVASYSPSDSVSLDSTTTSGKVKITNTFSTPTPTPETGKLTVSKIETGTLPSSGLPSEYKFYVTSDGKYVQADGSLGDSEYDFAVTAGDSVTIEGLALGKSYVVKEVEVTGLPTGYICSTTYSSSDTVVLDETNKDGSVEITNTYTFTGTPTPGSITVAKVVVGTTPASGMPSEFKFTIMSGTDYVQDDGTLSPDRYEFTIGANDSITITGLELDKTYVIAELDVTGLPTGYTCTPSYSGDTITLETSGNDSGTCVITNTFTGPTPTPPLPTKGSLSVTKDETGDVPSSGKPSSYTFYVMCGSEYVQDATSGTLGSNKVGFSVVAGGTTVISGLELDKTYEVVEADVNGLPDGYTCSSSVSPSTVYLEPTNADGSVIITNDYTYTTPSPTPSPSPSPSPSPAVLSFTKAFSGDVLEDEIIADDIYFIIERTDSSVTDKYLKADGTFTSNADEAHIRLADLVKTSGKLIWSKEYEVPAGEYKVTEFNQDILVGQSKLKYVCLSSSITTDTTTVDPTGSLELYNEYELPGLDVTISKQDVAGKEIPHATLKLTSLDGYDLSGVSVVQRKTGEPLKFTLSDNNTAISFDTIENDSAIIVGLRAGKYTLEETVTPEAFLTADKITIELHRDGTFTDDGGTIWVQGSPLIMIDKADPTWGGPKLPPTGEETSITAIAGVACIVLCALTLTGLGLYRVKKKREEA